MPRWSGLCGWARKRRSLGPTPAAADLRGLRHRPEDRVGAAGGQRNVERVGLRVVGHRPQVLEAARAGAVVHRDVELRDPLPAQDALAGRRMQVHDVLEAEVVGGEVLAGLRIELPEDADLAHLEQPPPVAAVDDDQLEHLVEVVRLGRNVLEVPLDLAGLRVERQRRVAVQRRALGAALRAGPGLGLRGGPVDQVGVRVVAAGDPGVGAGPERERQVAPGVAAGLARAGHRGGAPQLGAGLGVVGRDEADVVLVVLAARDARDHHALHDDGAARVAVAELVVGHLLLPHHLAGAGVERDELRLARAGVDLVVVDGDVAPRQPRLPVGGEIGVGRHRPARAQVRPELVAGDRVERHHAAAAGDVHDAVVDQRRHLVGAGQRLPRPDELQIRHVLAVDLVERAVALAIDRAAPVDPVARLGVEELGVGNRLEAGELRRDATAANPASRQTAMRHESVGRAMRNLPRWLSTRAGRRRRATRPGRRRWRWRRTGARTVSGTSSGCRWWGRPWRPATLLRPWSCRTRTGRGRRRR